MAALTGALLVVPAARQQPAKRGPWGSCHRHPPLQAQLVLLLVAEEDVGACCLAAWLGVSELPLLEWAGQDCPGSARAAAAQAHHVLAIAGAAAGAAETWGPPFPAEALLAWAWAVLGAQMGCLAASAVSPTVPKTERVAL